MQRTIATQAGLEDLIFALNTVADNLQSHVNQSLSRAHGIDIVPGYVDANGNDLTTYQDSNGDVVGNLFVRFQVSGQIYYAPANATALPGNPAVTGAINTAGENVFTGVGDSAWITDYTSSHVEQASNINAILIGHTQLPHNETHLVLPAMSALPQVTVDADGHTVGRNVVQVTVDNVIYNIPCDTRFGGPPQSARVAGFVVSFEGGGGGSYFFDGSSTIYASPDGGEPWRAMKIASTLAGTAPYTYAWQSSFDGVTGWTTVVLYPGISYPNNCGIADDAAYSPASGSANAGILNVGFFFRTPGGDNGGQFYMRLQLINGSGTSYSPVLRVVLQDHS